MQAQQWRKVITLRGQLGEMKTDMEDWGLCGENRGVEVGVGGCWMCSYFLSEYELSCTLRAELFLHGGPSRAVTPVPPQWVALGCGLGLWVALQIFHSTPLTPSLHSSLTACMRLGALVVYLLWTGSHVPDTGGTETFEVDVVGNVELHSIHYSIY